MKGVGYGKGRIWEGGEHGKGGVRDEKGEVKRK